jgi:catechol 2,3-dioxygenase-like lactoylglutathione lyase family enzyme
MAIISFHHTAISTPNLERLVAFYRDCFGFEPVFEFFLADAPRAADMRCLILDITMPGVS